LSINHLKRYRDINSSPPNGSAKSSAHESSIALYYSPLQATAPQNLAQLHQSAQRSQRTGSTDSDDLYDYITALAEQKMNGRQIRNAIPAARQLVLFDAKGLTYKQLNMRLKSRGSLRAIRKV
jgi:hypothetical protein